MAVRSVAMPEFERPNFFRHVETHPDDPELLDHTQRLATVARGKFERFPYDIVKDWKEGRSLVLDCQYAEPDTFTIRLQPMGRLEQLQVLAAKRGPDYRAVSSCSFSVLSRRHGGANQLVGDPGFDFCSFRETFGFAEQTVFDYTGETPSGVRPLSHAERVAQMLYPVIEGEPIGARAARYVELDSASGLFSG